MTCLCDPLWLWAPTQQQETRQREGFVIVALPEFAPNELRGLFPFGGTQREKRFETKNLGSVEIVATDHFGAQYQNQEGHANNNYYGIRHKEISRQRLGCNDEKRNVEMPIKDNANDNEDIENALLFGKFGISFA